MFKLDIADTSPASDKMFRPNQNCINKWETIQDISWARDRNKEYMALRSGFLK